MIEAKAIPDKFPCLVWVNSLKGPQPEIWHGPMFRDQKPIAVIASKALAEMSIDGLAKLAPIDVEGKIINPVADKDVDNSG